MKTFFTVILLGLGLVSCSGQKNEKGNVVRLSLTSEIPTIDPAVCYDVTCMPVIGTSYETLLEYDYLKRPYQLRPLLAEEMPLIEDGGKKLTFKIKKDIAYHPQKFFSGPRLVVAEDFINAFKRQAYKPTQARGWGLFENHIVGLDKWREKVNTMEAFYSTPIEGVQAVDQHTLVLHLTKPFPQINFALSMSFTSPIPIEAIKALNNDFTQAMVATGPFILKDYQQNQQAIFEKFADYKTSTYPTQGDRFANEQGLLKDAGKRLPFLDRIEMIVMKEPQTSWLNFMTEKLDQLVLTKDYYQAAMTEDGKLTKELSDKNVQIQGAPTLIYWWLQFNMKDPVVGKNLALRKAIAHAVDVERFIKLFTSNIGQKANSIYPPGIPGYDPSASLPYSYDPEKAKQYLKEAGYPDGKGLSEITFDVRNNATLHRQIAEFIVGELRKVGIPSKPNLNTFPVFLERARRGELQFWNGGWVMDYPDAENMLQLLTTKNSPPGSNYSSYSNKLVDGLIEKARILEDGPEKYELLGQIETQVNKDLPWVMLYYARNYVLSHQRIKNFRYSDIIFNSNKYLKVSAEN